MKTNNVIKRKFQMRETVCTIISDNEKAIEAAVSSIKKSRKELEAYIKENPHFLYSLEPVEVKDGPAVVIRMAEAAEKANVGPMAAVAGVLADIAVENMTKAGCNIAVVENGGEVSAISEIPIDIALLAGNHMLSGKIGFRLIEFPIGVATSSGLFSHALSFGEAEAVTIFAVNAGLADAVATAIGNDIRGKDDRKIAKLGVEKALNIEGVKGAMIIYKNYISIGGEIPQIINIKG
ncbi:UPF0280 family protein [Candidatus Bathyarchaeota archaeon]|nr:UPF0280 family protein [Candidatus Bathyarchaeota archaeon]